MTAKRPFNQIKFDMLTGKVGFALDGVPVDDAVEGVSFGVTYERPKGPKELTWIPQPPEDARFSPYSFLEQFDAVFAVDTNTREIGGIRRSVTAVAATSIELVRSGDGRVAQAILQQSVFAYAVISVEGCSPTLNPERLGWKLALEGLIPRYAGYRDGKRYALVVDSELGRLPLFNARQEPLVESFFLPGNFTMVYASTDAAMDLHLNKMIDMADKESSLQLEVLAAGKEPSRLFWSSAGDRQEVISGPFS
jgi:hypothetical protein